MTTHPAFAAPPSEPRLGVYNFSAGPSHMPIEVVDQVRDELRDLSETGIGLLEHSHRGPAYADANAEADEDPLRGVRFGTPSSPKRPRFRTHAPQNGPDK